MFRQVGISANNRLLRRSQPYRNQRIINVIRSVYFTGGVSSFARRFHLIFPTHCNSQGVAKREMPDAMVALVATAVSFSCLMLRHNAYLKYRCTQPSWTGEMAKRTPLTSQQRDTRMSTKAMSTRSRTCGIGIQISTTR
jgi:hypothetical protein